MVGNMTSASWKIYWRVQQRKKIKNRSTFITVMNEYQVVYYGPRCTYKFCSDFGNVYKCLTFTYLLNYI